MLRKVLSTVAVLATLSIAQNAHAYSLTSSISGMFGQTVKSYYGANNYNGYTGAQQLTFTAGGGGTPTGFPTTFVGYCVDLENVFVNPQSVTIRSTNDLTRNNLNPKTGTSVAWLYNTYGGAISNNTQGAALQVAIWEALYDSTLDLSNGFYRVDASSAAVISQANVYLSALQSNLPTLANATWFDPNSGGQGIVGPAAVPEPGLMSLLAGGSLSGLALLRRRRFSKRK